MLFGERNGALLVTVRPDNCRAFEALMAELPVHRLGTVTDEARLAITSAASPLVSMPVADLVYAWNNTP
jgi:hypothetical protein